MNPDTPNDLLDSQEAAVQEARDYLAKHGRSLRLRLAKDVACATPRYSMNGHAKCTVTNQAIPNTIRIPIEDIPSPGSKTRGRRQPDVQPVKLPR